MNKTSKSIVVLGATSGIAHELCRLHADKGDSLILCARNKEALHTIADDITSRYQAKVDCIEVDFSEPESYAQLTSQVAQLSNDVDSWYVFYGTLPDQTACEQSVDNTRAALQINFTSIIDILTSVANVVEKRKAGSIVVVSSVAGDRGRSSNYVYGTAKGAVTIFLQGLRNRLQKSGGHVLTVKPGFVATPMTAHLEQKGLLWATPDKVAADIYSAAEKKKDVLYTPWFWQPIMLIIKAIPEALFKRLSL